MASRFWVGGTGTWDLADTTHWSATDGGASGASVPTAADDVKFTALSGAGSATLAAATLPCLSFDATGYTGTIVMNSSTTILRVSGSFTLSAGMTLSLTNQPAIVLLGTGAPTITCAGKTIPNLQMQSVSGTYTALDALLVGAAFTLSIGNAGTPSLTLSADGNTAGNVNLTAGTFNTGGKTCNWATFTSSNSNARTLTLGASAITITGTGVAWDCTTSTGLTVTASTATITMTGAGPTFRSGAKSWPTLVFNGFTASAVISGNGTFAAVSFIGPATKFATISISAGTTTVTGLLTITGNSVTNRLLAIGNGSPGFATTWSAGSTSLANVDWRDTVGTGAAAPFAGTSMGDALGNSGITFDAPVTRFAVAAGNWSSTATWSASSGGAPGATVPLPQDTVKLDAASPAGTYTADMPRVGKNIDFTGFTRTFTHASAITYYGAWTAVATMTWNGAGGIICEARSIVGFTSAGKTIPTGLTMNGFGGTLRLVDPLTGNSSISLITTAGTIDLNGQATTFGSFSAGGAALVRSLAFGGATLTLTGTGTVFTGGGTNFTTSGSGVIDITDATAPLKTFAGGSFVYPTLRYRPAGGAALTITGSNTFANLDLEATTARTINLQSGQAQFVLGTLTIQGAAAQLLSFASTTAGSQTALWLAVGGTLVQSFTSLSADVLLLTGQTLASMNVIDDVDRVAALSWGTTQVGGSTDGRAVPGGLAVWEGGTNLFRQAQCDSTTDWNAGGSAPVIATDATVPAPFSTQSIKLTSSLAGLISVNPSSAAGQAMAAGTSCCTSMYFRGNAGQTYSVRSRVGNTDASTTDGVVSSFTAGSGAWPTVVDSHGLVWEVLTPAAVAVAVGKTGDTVKCVVVQTGAARVESFWVAHVMLQKGVNTVGPYVATSGGVTAARSGATLQMASSYIGLAQGAVAMRWRMGGTPAQMAAEYGASNPIRLFGFGMDSAEKFALFPSTNANGSFTLNYQHAGVSVSVVSAAGAWVNAGDVVTIVVAWTATGATISVNGANFVAGVIAGGQTWQARVFFFGGDQNGTVPGDSTLLWAATMTGVPTNADAARFAALGNHDPSFAGISAAAQVTAVAPADTPAYEVPLALVSSPTLAFA